MWYLYGTNRYKLPEAERCCVSGKKNKTNLSLYMQSAFQVFDLSLQFMINKTDFPMHLL